MSTARLILFPVDFSERCKAVRPSVIAMAKHFGARLTLMHVLPIPIGLYGGMGEAYPVMFDVSAVTENAHRQLDAFTGTPEPSLEIDTIVESGEPAACITEYAERNDVGMIMIPTHGYGKFRSLLLGSVTAKVLHDAKCVVWTSAHTEDPLLAGRAQYKTILCAVGLKPKNSGLICYAASLAASFNAQLRLVHAVSFAETRPQEFGETDFSGSLLQMSREEIAIRQQEAGTDVPVCLELGSVSNVVRRAALEHNADLVVIGRGRLHETFGRLRTNEYAIIRDSPCPVVSA